MASAVLNDPNNVRFTLLSRRLHKRADLGDVDGLEDLDSGTASRALQDSENLQMHTKSRPKKHLMYRIVAKTRYTFQIDVMFMPKGMVPLNPCLLVMVDVASRMMFAAKMKDKSADEIVRAYDSILALLARYGVVPTAVTGDMDFKSQKFVQYNGQQNPPIQVYLVNAQEDDVTRGNRLGIINRAIRTLRMMFDKWMVISGKNYIAGAPEVLRHYNTHPNRALNRIDENLRDARGRKLEPPVDRSPADVFTDEDFHKKRLAVLTKENAATMQRSKRPSNNLKHGDTVRILTKKGLFDKDGINFTQGACEVSGRHTIGVPSGWGKGFRIDVDSCGGNAALAERNWESYKRWEMFKVDPRNPRLKRIDIGARSAVEEIRQANIAEASRRKMRLEGLGEDLINSILPQRPRFDIITAWDDLLPPNDSTVTTAGFDNRLTRLPTGTQSRAPTKPLPNAPGTPPEASFYAAVAASVMAVPLGLVPTEQQVAVKLIQAKVLRYLFENYSRSSGNPIDNLVKLAQFFVSEYVTGDRRSPEARALHNKSVALLTASSPRNLRSIAFLDSKKALLEDVATRVRAADASTNIMQLLVARSLKVGIIVADPAGQVAQHIWNWPGGRRQRPRADVFIRRIASDEFVGLAGVPLG